MSHGSKAGEAFDYLRSRRKHWEGCQAGSVKDSERGSYVQCGTKRQRTRPSARTAVVRYVQDSGAGLSFRLECASFPYVMVSYLSGRDYGRLLQHKRHTLKAA